MPDPIVARLQSVGAALRAPAAAAAPVVDVSRLRLLLEPDARPTDDAQWARYLRSLDRPDPRAGAKTARWWCRSCSAFVREESCECAKCRDRGPHHFGEDSPLAVGNRARRARLRAEHAKRHGRTKR